LYWDKFKNISSKVSVMDLLYVTSTGFPGLKKGNFGGDRIDYYSKKFDNIYILGYGKEEIYHDENKVYVIGSPIAWFRYFLKLNKSKISFVKTDDFFIGGFFAVIFSKLLNKPLVFRCGSLWLYKTDSFSKLIKNVIRNVTKVFVLRYSDRIVCNSNAIAKVLRGYKNKIRIVYNGVNLDIFKPIKTKHKSKTLRVLFGGRVCAEKGLDYLFESLKNENEVELIIAGDGAIDVYKRKAMEEGVYGKVKFLGFVSHDKMPDLINSCDAVILPSLKTSAESFPNALLEGMACGKVVISTNVWGVPELVGDGINGFLVPEKDANAIKVRFERLKNKGLRAKLAREARKTAENFNWETQMEKLYKALFI